MESKFDFYFEWLIKFFTDVAATNQALYETASRIYIIVISR